MRTIDIVKLSGSSIRVQPLRALLTVLGIAIGIAAVILLTSIGEGVRHFVLSEFTQFGTNIIGINPGRATTHGASVGVFGTDRPLSLEDSMALTKIPHVLAVVPVVQGNAEVEYLQKRRRTTIYGVGPSFPEAFKFKTLQGSFLPEEDVTATRALAVLGSKSKQELFGDTNPLGKKIRIGGSRFIVVGSMESKGQVLGFDLDDTVYIPAARALQLFNRNGLMEIDIVYSENAPEQEVVDATKRILISRHGREDFTLTTQQQMLDILGSILNVLKFAVAGLGSISLIVGGVGILAIMIIAVRERTGEIGLLRAIGAEKRDIRKLFFMEAAILAALGGVIGLVIGVGSTYILRALVPALPVHFAIEFVLLSQAVAVGIGLLAGVLPATRAANLTPVEALRAE